MAMVLGGSGRIEARRADHAASGFIITATTLTVVLVMARPLWQGGMPVVLALLALLYLSGLSALLLARRQGRRALLLCCLTMAVGTLLGGWLIVWLWLAPAWAGTALAMALQAPLLLHFDVRGADDVAKHGALLAQQRGERLGGTVIYLDANRGKAGKHVLRAHDAVHRR